MVKITQFKTLISLLFFIIFMGLIKQTFAHDHNSQKLMLKYSSTKHLDPQLIHSEFSNRAANQNQQSTSYKQEWYQDNQGDTWYAWEEREVKSDGHWHAVNFGLVKKGFTGYQPMP